MSFTLVTVTGSFIRADGITPSQGEVLFRLTSPLYDPSTQTSVSNDYQRAVMDDNGDISIVLTALDDVGITPQGAQYEVTEHHSFGRTFQYFIEITTADAPTVDLATLVQETGTLTDLGSSITSAVASKVAKAGDIMTGLLTLSGDPSTSLQAAPKQYVDAAKAAAIAASQPADADLSAIAANGATATGLAVLGAASQAAARSAISAQEAGTSVQLPTALDAPRYFISKGAGASDSNDGLSMRSAFATLAGALTAIGGTTDNTNAAIIEFGYGTFGSSGTPIPTATIKGVKGFRITGQGQHLTSLWGPDAAALFKFVNCERAQVTDVQYLGSPTATGWFIENDTNYSGGYVGGVTSTEFNLHDCIVGDSTAVAPVAAYGVRWMLNGADWHNDRTNDAAAISDVAFSRIGQPLSVEHSNSLVHRITDCSFINCDGVLKLQGGSATLINPVVHGASGIGWIIDMQDPAGSSSLVASAQAVYFHPTTVIGIQSEANQMGWARSSANAGIGVSGASWPLTLTFIGGELNAGPYGGAGGQVVDWEAGNVNTNRYSHLNFIGVRLIPRVGTLVYYVPDPKSHLSFIGCDLYTDACTFNWGGLLSFTNCTGMQTAPTFTPISTATKTVKQCTGALADTAVTDVSVPAADVAYTSGSTTVCTSGTLPVGTYLVAVTAEVLTGGANAFYEFRLQADTATIAAQRYIGNSTQVGNGLFAGASGTALVTVTAAGTIKLVIEGNVAGTVKKAGIIGGLPATTMQVLKVA